MVLSIVSCLVDAAFHLSALESLPSTVSWQAFPPESESAAIHPMQEFRRGITPRPLSIRAVPVFQARDLWGHVGTDSRGGVQRIDPGGSRVERCSEITKPDALRLFLFGTPQNHRAPPV